MLIANVVAMRTREVGDYVYRVSQPSIALGREAGVEVVTVGMLSPHLADVVLAADVAILHLLCEDDLFPLLAARQRLGRPTVYEISDNILEPADGTGISGWFADPDRRGNALALMGAADAVQVTGRGLAERFASFVNGAHIFPNQVASLGPAPRPVGEQVTIGWGGSASHLDDLELLAPALTEVCRRHANAVFAFMGDQRLFARFFSHLPATQRRYHAPGSLEDYYHFLSTLDIGVAPLAPTAYNLCRSDVKFVEYASRGVAPVLSAVGPYLDYAAPGETALLWGSPQELVGHLSDLVAQGEKRSALAHRAYDYVKQQRLESDSAGQRLGFYRRLLTRSVSKTRELPPGSVRLDPGSAAWEVESSPAEDLLVAGIRAESEGRLDEARQAYKAAQARDPSYRLPWFWLGRSLERGGDDEGALACLRKAAAGEPPSLRALLHLARLEAKRDPRRALALIERSALSAPLHAPLLELAADLRERLGDLEAARDYYQAAFETNPASSTAAASLGRFCARTGQPLLALAALERAVELSPSDAALHCDCAEQYLAHGEADRAYRHGLRALELAPRAPRPRALAERLLAAA